MPVARRVVGIIVGTRPEMIKLAPIIGRLKSSRILKPYVLLTGQHDSLMDPLVRFFDIDVDKSLPMEPSRRRLPSLVSDLLVAVDRDLPESTAGVVVQGDTSSALAGAMVGAFRQLPVFHVEAGLRSGDTSHPFPEEYNRKLISVLADVHYAPTNGARQALLAEGYPPPSMRVVGNSVVDALYQGLNRNPALPSGIAQPPFSDNPGLLVTLHRRENWGPGIGRLCRALASMLDCHSDLTLVFPMHPNPDVRNSVVSELGDHDRALLLPAVGYAELVALLNWCNIVVTDSGGLQEEAPALGKPVVVCRERTERPEGVAAGNATLVGTDPDKLKEALSRLLTDSNAYVAMSTARSPYGDGRASERIVTDLELFFGGTGEPLPEFQTALEA